MEHLRLIVFTVLLMLAFALPATAQDATPEPTPVELVESHTDSGSDITIDYPEGWTFKEDDNSEEGVYFVGRVASDEALLEYDVLSYTSGEMKSGDVAIQFGFGTRDYFTSNMPGVDSDSGPLEMTIAFAGLVGDTGDVTFDEPKAVEINDLRAAEVSGKAEDRGAFTVLIVEYDRDLLGLFYVAAPPGELEQWEPTLLAMAKSVTIGEGVEATPEATEEAFTLGTALTLANGTTLSYPDDWSKAVISGYAVFLGSNDAALNRAVESTLKEGEVQVFVAVDTIANLTPALNLGIASDASSLEFAQALVDLQDATVDFEEPEEITFGEHPAAFVSGSTDGLDVSAYVIDLGDNVMALVRLLTPKDELDQWQPVADAIAESITFNS